MLVASDSYLDNTPGTGLPLTIRDVSLEGNRENNTAATDGLVLRSWQTVVEDVHIEGFGGSGIRLTNLGAGGAKLATTEVNGIIKDSFIDASGRSGVFVEDTGNSVTDWQLTGNWIADSGQRAISLDNAAGWVINDNHLYGVGTDGIWAQRLYGTTITDNYVEGFGEGTAGTYYGIGGQLQGDAASTIALNRVFAFRGEKPSSTYRYIGIAAVTYGDGVVTVTGNVVRGAGSTNSTGLFYDKGTGGSLSVASTGNLVTAVATPLHAGEGVKVTSGQ